MIFVQLIFLHVEACLPDTTRRIDKVGMVTKSWLLFEAFHRCMGSFTGAISTNEFDVLLSIRKDIEVLDNEDAVHDA